MYRTQGGRAASSDPERGAIEATGTRATTTSSTTSAVLRDTFAARLARALTPDDFAAVFADPDQLSLFASALGSVRPVLTVSEPAPG